MAKKNIISTALNKTFAGKWKNCYIKQSSPESEMARLPSHAALVTVLVAVVECQTSN